MTKTLLLTFIHGFKGDEDTFGDFPNHIRALLSHALPQLAIGVVVYPTFETRGDLQDCVHRFRDWLTNKVIDLEVANETPSPIVEPSVRTILVGHSMGGIVAAETALAIAAERQISGGLSQDGKDEGEVSGMMFPYIQGILAFDTPYLGIAPGVVAHSAEGQWNFGKNAYEAYQSAAGIFGAKSASSPSRGSIAAAKPLPPSIPDVPVPTPAAASNSSGYASWGRYAMFAGAASAVAAVGSAAYLKRDSLITGVTWAQSHLAFVGCLARGQDLKTRLAAVAKLEQDRGIGFANIYTCLGKAVENTSSWSTKALGEERTFCNLPNSELRRYFHPAINDKAVMETLAHMYMFGPKTNPGYYGMSERAKELIALWVDTKWYETTLGKSSNDGVSGEVNLDDEHEDIDLNDE